mmetsp:Transcript_2583/g.7901  ORF Transcript_2583/g.7901 Transcript_2583/m.7901 type:complete len:236 (-) Transcript_2583:233-940(-)
MILCAGIAPIVIAPPVAFGGTSEPGGNLSLRAAPRCPHSVPSVRRRPRRSRPPPQRWRIARRRHESIAARSPRTNGCAQPQGPPEGLPLLRSFRTAERSNRAERKRTDPRAPGTDRKKTARLHASNIQTKYAGKCQNRKKNPRRRNHIASPCSHRVEAANDVLELDATSSLLPSAARLRVDARASTVFVFRVGSSPRARASSLSPRTRGPYPRRRSVPRARSARSRRRAARAPRS